MLRGDCECDDNEGNAVGLVDQVWIDRMPVREKDKVNVLAMLSDAEFGVFNESSAYEGRFSLFQFKERKGKLALTMLQTDSKHKLTYAISTKGCGAVFEYCLKVTGAPLGPQIYGTMREWTIDASQVTPETLATAASNRVFTQK